MVKSEGIINRNKVYQSRFEKFCVINKKILTGEYSAVIVCIVDIYTIRLFLI